MARGLLSVGEDYQGLATKGFIRADELEEQINMRNAEMSAQGKMQRQKMGMELGTVGGVAGYSGGQAVSGIATEGVEQLGSSTLGEEAGAEIGTDIYPGVGTVVGAALGFLVSKLF